MTNSHSIRLTLFFLVLAGFTKSVHAEIIPSGSYIINMGITPQTINNGLKPYGLIYDLVKNYKVPIKWVINPTKSKDGIDFTHNGFNYSGGTFIISAEFRTSTINSVIANWVSQGIVGATSVSDLSLDVYHTIYFAPSWTLDRDNGNIATSYFINAGIPADAHGGSTSLGWKTPAQLDGCDDIFVMPHADPSWATHSNLYYWNLNHKGNIWMSCHAISVLENTTNPGNTIKMNFLTTNGLVDYNLHGDASPAFTYNYPTDPIMQFMGTLDGSITTGSEQNYLPSIGSSWLPSTMVGVSDATTSSIPSMSAGPAAILAYGRAYGDNNRGYVMYEAGHDHDKKGTVAERVAAQRAFFNYSFLSTNLKNSGFDIVLSDVPEVLMQNQPIALSFTVPSYITISDYTIQWSSSRAGNFSPNANQQSVDFTPTETGSSIISVTIIDACGRQVFKSDGVVVAGVLPVKMNNFTGKYNPAKEHVELDWTHHSTEQVQSFEVEVSFDGMEFTSIGIVLTGEGLTSDFNFIHKNIMGHADKIYYRLKIKSGNGYSYSGIITVTNIKGRLMLLNLAPNPTCDYLHINYYSDEQKMVTIRIIDISGRITSKQEKLLLAGSSKLQQNVKGLPPGIYNLQLIDNHKVQTKKFIIRF